MEMDLDLGLDGGPDAAAAAAADGEQKPAIKAEPVAETAAPAAAAPASTRPEAAPRSLRDLEKTLQQTIDDLYHIAVTVHDYQPDSGPVLVDRVERFVAQLQALDAHARDDAARAARLPIDLIGFVEQGRNPDLYTRDVVSALVDRQQKTLGRREILHKLEQDLAAQIAANLPSLAADINDPACQRRLDDAVAHFEATHVPGAPLIHR